MRASRDLVVKRSGLLNSLRSSYRTGLADLIERTCRHARSFADGVSDAGYEVLNEVVLNQVLVSFGDADATNKIIAELQADGTCWWRNRMARKYGDANQRFLMSDYGSGCAKKLGRHVKNRDKHRKR